MGAHCCTLWSSGQGSISDFAKLAVEKHGSITVETKNGTTTKDSLALTAAEMAVLYEGIRNTLPFLLIA